MRHLWLTILALSLILAAADAQDRFWKQYADSAKVFTEQKNIDKAIEFFNKAKEALTKDSALTNTYAGICNSLANLYFDMGQYNEAEPLYIESKKIREKVLDKEHPDYVESCKNLAALYMYIGQYNEAEPLYIEAKQIRGKILGKEHPDYAASCLNLGLLYLYMGQYEKAEPLLSEARQKLGESLGNEHANYALSCNTLGALYRDMGQFKKAELLNLEAKQIWEKTFGKENLDYARTCNNLAILYWDLGQYAKAELLYLESRQIWEKVLGKEHPDYALSCNNLAIFYWQIGQYKKAEPLFYEAKRIWEKVWGKEHPDYAVSCDNLASLYFSMGKYEKAEPFCLEGKYVREKALGQEHPEYASSCDNLANLYKNMGQYKKAEPLFLEAKQIRGKVLGKEHPDYGLSCHNLALFYQETGQYEKAEPLYAEALHIFEKVGKETPDYVESCQALATLYWNQKNPEKAIEIYKEALTAQNNQLNKVFQFTSEAEMQSYVKKFSDHENHFFSFSTSLYPHSRQGLSYDVSLSHRNLILSSSQQLRNIIYTATDTSIKNKYTAWIDIREQLASWYTKPATDRPAYVSGLETQAEKLEKELARLSLAFSDEQRQKNVTWKDVHQHLKPDEAAIEFVKFNFYDGRRMTDSIYYIAFLLRKDKNEPVLIPLFESGQIEKLLGAGNTLNTVFSFYGNKDKPNDAFNLIWKPIEKHLEAITLIYFAPAGILHRISFAALPLNYQQVLSDKYQLVQLNTTASLVNQSNGQINTNDHILLYGAIQYDADSTALRKSVAAFMEADEPASFFKEEDTRGSSWQYLPGTEKEINGIQSLGKQKRYSFKYTGGISASEESVKALNGNHSPAVLHIATHGFFFPDPNEQKETLEKGVGSGAVFRRSDNPLLRAGLLFAGANNAWAGKPIKGLEDGILTAYEVSNLYLPNTKLVVLSACETGLGDIQGNEGVYGLQRAFKMAGVENLVMSLWKVPDKTTAEFMQEFYKDIFDKQSINVAFNNAQTVMKNRYRKDPYKWAAWILVR